MSGKNRNAVMIQGTGSNVGKSMLVAGLCRAAVRRGLSCAPFKPQNMSNNAAVTADGGEIGRAQALQARACGLEPVTDMNPVLLKPETDTGAQIVLQGHSVGRVQARDYAGFRPRLISAVHDSFRRLADQHDIVIVEGAGSPAEVNLRARDIANMGFAREAGVPVILAGDIDRGGIIAQIVGTQVVLDPADAAMIRGFLINKFRGDPGLFSDGYSLIEKHTGWRGFGILPWFGDAHRLPAEDAVDIRATSRQGMHVVCLTFSRIANFDDLDPLAGEPGLRLTMLGPGQPIPGDADLVILPGTKSTLGDLAFMRSQGWDLDLAAHVRRGGHVLGICGGFQMLGKLVRDPSGLDGTPGTTDGLGLLDIETTMEAGKSLTRVTGEALGRKITGYEIHLGRSAGPDCKRPFAHIPSAEGAVSRDGRIMGTYLHGLFANDEFRAGYLARLGASSQPGFERGVEQALEDLADLIENNLDVTGILAVAGSTALC